MGQSALSQTRKRVEIGVCQTSRKGSWCKPRFTPALLWRKEIGLIIPNLEAEQVVTLTGSTEAGNRNKLTDVVTSLGESCLFFVSEIESLEVVHPEIGTQIPKSTTALVVSEALVPALENVSA
jgi:hypothetical protein